MNRNSQICFRRRALSAFVTSFAVMLGFPATAQTPAPTATPEPTVSATAYLTPAAVQSEILALKPVANDEDLWDRVRRGFQMKDLDSPLVRDQERWYAARPDYIQRFVERGSKYLYHIVEEVERRGLPTEIVLLPIIESAFNPQAYSRAHASGMWQFIPSTGKSFGLQQSWLADNRRDVVLSTNAALDYLTMLYGMFNSWELAFAAYNCGEGCVGRAIAANERRGKPTDFSSLNLPKETRSYVPKLMAVRNIIISPSGYGITLASVKNTPYFTAVPAPEQIDIRLAARLADMDESEFAALNPASTKPVAATATGTFLVPTERAQTFRENLDLYRSLNGPMVSWQTAHAKVGESVDAVAKRHGVTPSYLRATSGPFKERKGKFTRPASFLVPSARDAKAILATLERKVELRNAGGLVSPERRAVVEGDDAPLTLSNSSSFAVTSVGNSTPANDGPAAAPSIPVATVTPGPPRTFAPQTGSAAAPPAPPTSPKIADREIGSAASPTPTTYRVRSGDTLFAIARKFDLDVEEIKRDNRLRTNNLQVGQVLKLDVASDSKPISSAASAASAPSVAPTAAKATAKTYTIKPGDTLYGIATQFSVPLNQLLAANNLHVQSVIQPGTRLKLSPQ